MSDGSTSISEPKHRVARFVRVRAWEQFQSPKDLIVSIAIAAAELTSNPILWHYVNTTFLCHPPRRWVFRCKRGPRLLNTL